MEKLVHKCNKRGVEDGKKSKKSINVEGGFFFLWRVEFFKIGKHDYTFIKEMRVHWISNNNYLIIFLLQHKTPYKASLLVFGALIINTPVNILILTYIF